MQAVHGAGGAGGADGRWAVTRPIPGHDHAHQIEDLDELMRLRASADAARARQSAIAFRAYCARYTDEVQKLAAGAEPVDGGLRNGGSPAATIIPFPVAVRDDPAISPIPGERAATGKLWRADNWFLLPLAMVCGWLVWTIARYAVKAWEVWR